MEAICEGYKEIVKAQKNQPFTSIVLKFQSFQQTVKGEGLNVKRNLERNKEMGFYMKILLYGTYIN